MRQADIQRNTAETEITLSLCLEGGQRDIQTGVGFLDHMLNGFARHGGFGLTVQCRGDSWVDDHHSVEDVGICLGDAFAQALGDLRGVERFGQSILPMDEALILSAVDLSGRGMLCYDLQVPTQKVGTFDTELVEEFLIALARRGDRSIHVRQLAGNHRHHIIEGAFKRLARSLAAAASVDPRFSQEIPSTKGVL